MMHSSTKLTQLRALPSGSFAQSNLLLDWLPSTCCLRGSGLRLRIVRWRLTRISTGRWWVVSRAWRVVSRRWRMLNCLLRGCGCGVNKRLVSRLRDNYSSGVAMTVIRTTSTATTGKDRHHNGHEYQTANYNARDACTAEIIDAIT